MLFLRTLSILLYILKKAPQTWGRKLINPQTDKERDFPIEKSSPNMGTKTPNRFTERYSLECLLKKAPQTWGRKLDDIIIYITAFSFY